MFRAGDAVIDSFLGADLLSLFHDGLVYRQLLVQPILEIRL